jgi:hypothetical protein
MPEQFDYDVFLSHSSKDKNIVRPLAQPPCSDAPIKDSLAQFLCINWHPADRERVSAESEGTYAD